MIVARFLDSPEPDENRPPNAERNDSTIRVAAIFGHGRQCLSSVERVWMMPIYPVCVRYDPAFCGQVPEFVTPPASSAFCVKPMQTPAPRLNG